jgi:hypothetical protein
MQLASRSLCLSQNELTSEMATLHGIPLLGSLVRVVGVAALAI